ncbi:MAG: chemotaxis protein CheB [Bacteroidota bacterium]
MKTTQLETNKSLHIVGIGASAGGLEALGLFLDNCPEDANIAFVIVQHLSPDHKSMMSNLLTKHTLMPISVAEHDALLKPNQVYLIPVDKNLIVEQGRFQLTQRAPRNEINLPIDIFFKSLARQEKERAIGVILSGTGSDGTLGGRTIKDEGGVMFVQEPETTQFDGMPLSAIKNGLADYVLPVSEIPLEIRNYIDYPEDSRALLAVGLAHERPIEEILRLLKRNTDYNFLEYRRQTLTRRILKRLKINKLDHLQEYLELLQENEAEQHILAEEFLIGVTSFFRNPIAFKTLELQVLPALIETAQAEQRDLKIWSIGCSTGEEAYSIAILLEKIIAEKAVDVKYKIFATDIDRRAVDRASKGLFHALIRTSIADDALLAQYFIPKGELYEIKSNIRKNIIFSRHDILHNPPFNKMDLISCRNMLIYFESPAQKKALSRIHFALNLNAYLFLGSSESLGVLSKSFKAINRKQKVFQNIQAASKIDLVNSSIANLYPTKRGNRVHRSSVKDQLDQAINHNLIEAMNGICVCLDQNYDIVHAMGDLNRYGSLPKNGFSKNIEAILPVDFTIPIINGIKELQQTPDMQQLAKHIQLVHHNSSVNIKLFITNSRLKEHTASPVFIVTLLELERKQHEQQPIDLVAASTQKYEQEIKELKQALANNRENLQLTVEELETSNEEIQATNEELVASNEELQSTNEELQSVNEELHTINSELQEKNTDLIQSNSDIENLINSTDIGTIFLDKNFRLRRFTSAISDQIELQASDVGRHIQNFSWADPNLLEDAKRVLKTLQPVRKEIQLKDGTWYLQQVLPYRTQDDLIDGITINFVHIQSIKDSMQQLEELNYFLSEIDSVLPAVIYIYDLERHINIHSSRSIGEILGYSKQDIRDYGDNLIPTIMSPASLPDVIAHHEKMRQQTTNETQFIEYQMRAQNGTFNWVSSYDKPFKRNAAGQVAQIIGVAQNVTEEKHHRLEAERLKNLFSNITQLSPAIIYIFDLVEQKLQFANTALCNFLDCSEEDLYSVGNRYLVNFMHLEDVPAYRQHLTALQNNSDGTSHTVGYRIKNKSGDYFWMSAAEKVYEYDENGQPIKIIGVAQDESKQKAYQQQLQRANEELKRFAYISSHDLKEPLNTVVSLIDAIKMEMSNADEGVVELLNLLDVSTTRMRYFIDDLLSYSTLGQQKLQVELVDLNALLTEIEQGLGAAIANSGAKIVRSNLPKVQGDTMQLHQLFQNLLSNAIKYHRPGVMPYVEIGVTEKPKHWLFHIEDNGIGVAQKNLDKIFEIFQKLHTRDEYEGTGIGLANCKRIVQKHGGKIWITSELDTGSTFFFTIAKKLKATKS